MMARKVRREMAKRLEAEGAIVAAKAEESKRSSRATWSGKPSLRQMASRISRMRHKTRIKKTPRLRRLKIKKIPDLKNKKTTKPKNKPTKLPNRCLNSKTLIKTKMKKVRKKKRSRQLMNHLKI